MFTSDQYQLLDFGQGRKLERFGSYIIDRPAPAAVEARRAGRQRWDTADACYDRVSDGRGEWLTAGGLPENWMIRHALARFEIRPTPFGHLGVFAEQAANWDWIANQVRACDRPQSVLNLFAYTGGSTLAAASAGARVVHIDAASNVVRWARKNAKLSGLESAPIRWITEDARRFAERELRRGNRYDAIILDPPSYGHGPHKQPFMIDSHLPALLDLCGELTGGRLAWLLLTSHSPNWDETRMRTVLEEVWLRGNVSRLTFEKMNLVAADGRQLSCGVAARWTAAEVSHR